MARPVPLLELKICRHFEGKNDIYRSYNYFSEKYPYMLQRDDRHGEILFKGSIKQCAEWHCTQNDTSIEEMKNKFLEEKGR